MKNSPFLNRPLRSEAQARNDLLRRPTAAEAQFTAAMLAIAKQRDAELARRGAATMAWFWLGLVGVACWVLVAVGAWFWVAS